MAAIDEFVRALEILGWVADDGVLVHAHLGPDQGALWAKVAQAADERRTFCRIGAGGDEINEVATLRVVVRHRVVEACVHWGRAATEAERAAHEAHCGKADAHG